MGIVRKKMIVIYIMILVYQGRLEAIAMAIFSATYETVFHQRAHALFKNRVESSLK